MLNSESPSKREPTSQPLPYSSNVSGTSVGYKFSSDPFYARLIKGNLDIDADGQVTPLTDGLLLIRSFFGFTGEALISGVVGLEAERRDAESIQAAITELGYYSMSIKMRI